MYIMCTFRDIKTILIVDNHILSSILLRAEFARIVIAQMAQIEKRRNPRKICDALCKAISLIPVNKPTPI